MNRDTYLKKLRARLDEWNADLDRLEAKAREAKQDVRSQYENEVEALRGRIDEAQSRFDEIQSAGEDTWKSLKDGAEDFWNRINEAMEDAKAAIR